MKKYVVYMVTYSGQKLPKYYIGSTSEEKVNKGYLGSVRSKRWREIFESEVKSNREMFKLEILSFHTTREDALSEELRIQKELNVVKSDEFFNESFASKNGFFGMTITEEYRKILSERAAENHKNGKCFKLKPMYGEDNPMHGKINEVVAIDGLTNKKVRVTKEEFMCNPHLSGHTVGLVPVIEIETGNKLTISKEEFNQNNDKYKHHNKGRKHSGDLKSKLSKINVDHITARDWDGNFHRIHKDDLRLKSGEFGNTTSKRWIITDLDGNIYKTLNFRSFFIENNLQFPSPSNIVNGVIVFQYKLKKNDKKSTNGWLVSCLD